MGDFGLREALEPPSFACGVRDAVATDGGYWAIKELRWAMLSSLDGIDSRRIVRDAFARISTLCGLSFVEVDPDERPNILFDTGRGKRAGLDGPGNVLAWAQLPAPGQREGTLLNRADMAENWVDLPEGQEPPRGTINAPPVYRHEIGHNLGLVHWPDGIMQAIYDWRLWSYLAVDAHRLQQRYGSPRGSKPIDPVKPDVPQLAELVAKAQESVGLVVEAQEQLERHAKHAAELLKMVRGLQ